MSTYPCRDVDLSFYSDAPERHVVDVELACTPERLFEILEDPASWSRWAPGIRKVEWTSPRPYGVGATRTVGLLGGMAIQELFTVWEPGRTLAFKVTEANQPVWWSFAERYDVVATTPGCCKLTWTVAYAPREGAFARMHPWIRPAMRATLRGFTLLLRRYVAKDARAGVATRARAYSR